VEYLAQHIESLIFTAEQPITFDEIKEVLEVTFEIGFDKAEIDKAIEEIDNRYKESSFSFELVEISNGYQFLTKGAYYNTIATYLKLTTKKRLSRAALETLSIIAYKQPVTKSEMEKIRGVSCDYSIQKLLEKELVDITGRSEGPGRPLLYGTSEKFMDYFGIKSLADLPKPTDFKTPDSEIGEAAPIEETIESGLSASMAPDELANLSPFDNALYIAIAGLKLVYPNSKPPRRAASPQKIQAKHIDIASLSPVENAVHIATGGASLIYPKTEMALQALDNGKDSEIVAEIIADVTAVDPAEQIVHVKKEVMPTGGYNLARREEE